MILIISKSNNPYFNLALEEYLFKNSSNDIILIYQNIPSIIIGKHQNINNEINHVNIYKNNIPVIRRLTGGGTVFHDLGNINFTVIKNTDTLNKQDYFINILYNYLTYRGLKVNKGERYDIYIDGHKISGSAQHFQKNRILSHNTLLFDSNLESIKKYLSLNSIKYKGNHVLSVYSNVTNLNLYISDDINSFIDDFSRFLVQFNIKKYELSNSDLTNIDFLMQAKYLTWEWNYAYCTDYHFNNKSCIGNYIFNIDFDVIKGIIKNFNISSSYLINNDINKIINIINNKKHSLDFFISEYMFLKKYFNVSDIQLINMFF